MLIDDFLKKSYTAFHAVANCEEMLRKHGFVKLLQGTEWKLNRGGRYYVTKNDSAIIAFAVGDLSEYAFNIAECHTDSPSLKVKGRKLLPSCEGRRVNVEKYGGLLLYSMLDIPLRLAGRLLIRKEGKIVSKNTVSGFEVSIPSLCIHHNIEANEKLSLNPQIDMLPLIGGDTDDLYQLLTEGEEVIDGDIFAVPDVASFTSGAKGEYFCSPRLDNLTSVYACISSICACEPKGVAFACCFDNEEIGSGTKQGAESNWLTDVLRAVNSSLGYGMKEYVKACCDGFVLSIDNGHAVHPAHLEKYDLNEAALLNKGIVIKHHTNYSTDGESSAIVKELLNKNGIPYQDYYNRSDLRCGGTLGLVTSAQLQIRAADIGLAQLAMHSMIEMVGKFDMERMNCCVKCFFNTVFKTGDDGSVALL